MTRKLISHGINLGYLNSYKKGIITPLFYLKKKIQYENL